MFVEGSDKELHLWSYRVAVHAHVKNHKAYDTKIPFLVTRLSFDIILNCTGTCPDETPAACGKQCYNTDECSGEKICCPDPYSNCVEHCVLPRFHLGMFQKYRKQNFAKITWRQRSNKHIAHLVRHIFGPVHLSC